MLRSQDEMNEWAEDQYEKMERARKAAKRAGANDEDADKLAESVITPPYHYFNNNGEESQESNDNWRDDDITPDQKTTIHEEIAQDPSVAYEFIEFLEKHDIPREETRGETLDNLTKGQASDFLSLIYDDEE